MSVPRYWREIPYRYRLTGSSCKKCGKVHFPPSKICRRCGSKELEDCKLPEKGKVLTYTVIRTPPKGYEHYAPYVVGIIELKNKVKIISQITDVAPEEVKIGMEVEATFRKVREDGEDGIVMYGYKFRPLTSSR